MCLVGGKIIFPKNNFSILRCLVKQGGENHFQGKIILSHLKKIVFLWKRRENDFSNPIFVAQFCLSFYFLLIVPRITLFAFSFCLSFFTSSSCSSMISIVNFYNYFLSSLILLQLSFWRTSQFGTLIVSPFIIFFNLDLISLKVNWVIPGNSEKIEIH